MNMPKEPLYKIGDLVKGHYDYADHIYYSVFDSTPSRTRKHVGVIIAVDHELYYFGEYIYTVLCIDGSTRFFLGDELASL